jgi:hypothetical protein
MKTLLTIFTIALLWSGRDATAQTNRFMNGSEGTEFWFSFPPNWLQSGTDNSLKIYVSCDVAVPCTLEVAGLGIRHVKMTKAGDVIEFTLTPAEGQPYVKNADRNSALSEEDVFKMGKGRGIHVFAEAPLRVYGVSGMVESFTALPVSALGTEYIVASYADVTARYTSQHLPSQVAIVAAYDNTNIYFTLGGSSGTKTVGGMERGQTKAFTLSKGDVVMFSNGTAASGVTTQPQDLSGSRIKSTKPVAVISANQRAHIPFDGSLGNFLMEMELPTHSWGTLYHIPYLIDRGYHANIKVFSLEPQTKLFREGKDTPFYVLETSGGNAGTGYYEGPVLPNLSKPYPVSYKADAIIGITMYNNNYDGKGGAPFQMVLTPVEQYQKEITFNTPGSKEGKGFSENYIALIFEGNMDETLPDSLDLGVVENGVTTWKPVNTFPGTPIAFAMWPGDYKKYFQKNITLPGDGVYKIRSSKLLTAYLYGSDQGRPYGHPASLLTNDLLKNDNTPPTILTVKDNKTSHNFSMYDTGYFPSGLSRIFLDPLASSNYRLKTDQFIAGQAGKVNSFGEVIDKLKPAHAEIIAIDRAGNRSLKTLMYTPDTTIAIDTEKPVPSYTYQECELCTEGIVTDSPSDSVLRSNLKSIILLSGSTNYTLQASDFTPGTSESALWKVCVVDQSKDASGMITFSDVAGNDTTIQLSYTAPAIQTTAPLHDYGVSKINEQRSRGIEVENTSVVSAQYITKVFLASGSNGFRIMAPAVLPDTLEPQESTNLVTIEFSSAVAGSFKDTLIIEINGCTPIHTALQAIAEGPSGVEIVYDPSFNISPNPATGFTTINLPLFKSQKPLLKVYDALGNQVADLTGRIAESSITFDTRVLPNGAYLVRFTDGGYSLLRTFVVNN